MQTQKQLTLECSICGEHWEEDELELRDDGRLWCTDCSDNYITCEHCGAVVCTDDAFEHPQGFVCEECYECLTCECDCCGERFFPEELYTMGDGCTVCEACEESEYVACSYCGECFRYDDDLHLHHDDYHGYYCDDCKDQVKPCGLYDYHEGPRPGMKGDLLTSTEMSLGFELELNGGDSNNYVNEAISDGLNEWFTFELDGSLYDGVEAICRPFPVHDLHYLINNILAPLTVIAKNNDMYADENITGMHIHVGRNFFSNQRASIFALRALLTHIKLTWDTEGRRNAWGREFTSYCDVNLDLKLYTDAYELMNLFINEAVEAEDVMSDIRFINVDKYQWRHSTALNLEHAETFELRFPGATLDPRKAERAFHVVVGMCDWANRPERWTAGYPTAEELQDRGEAYIKRMEKLFTTEVE